MVAEVAHSFFKAAKSLEADEMVSLGHVTLRLLPDEPRVQEEGRCIKALHELQDWGISLLPSDYYQVCTTLTICLLHAPVKSLRTSLPGELRLAPHAPSPGWHAFNSKLSPALLVYI